MFDAYNKQKEMKKQMEERKKVNDIKNLKMYRFGVDEDELKELDIDEDEYKELGFNSTEEDDKVLYYDMISRGRDIKKFDQALELAGTAVSDDVLKMHFSEYLGPCSYTEAVKLLAMNALFHNIDYNNLDDIILFISDKLSYTVVTEQMPFLYEILKIEDNYDNERLRQISMRIQKYMIKFEENFRNIKEEEKNFGNR